MQKFNEKKLLYIANLSSFAHTARHRVLIVQRYTVATHFPSKMATITNVDQITLPRRSMKFAQRL